MRARLLVALAVLTALGLGGATAWVVTHPRPPRFVDSLEKAVRAMPASEEARPVGLAWVAWTLGELGERGRALSLAAEAERDARAVASDNARATALARVAAVLDKAGDRERATALFGESIALVSSSGDDGANASFGAWLDAFGDTRSPSADDPLVAKARERIRSSWPVYAAHRRHPWLADLVHEVVTAQLAEPGPPASERLEAIGNIIRPVDIRDHRRPFSPEARATIIAAIEAVTLEPSGYFSTSCVVLALRGEEDPWRRALELARGRDAAGFVRLPHWIRVAALELLAESRRPCPERVEETLAGIEALGRGGTDRALLVASVVDTVPALAPGERGVAILASVSRGTFEWKKREDVRAVASAVANALARFAPSPARAALAGEIARSMLDRYAAERPRRDLALDAEPPEILLDPLIQVLKITPELAPTLALAVHEPLAIPLGPEEESVRQFNVFYYPRAALAACARAAARGGDLERARTWFVASGTGSDRPDVDRFDAYLLLRRRLAFLDGAPHELRDELGQALAAEIVKAVPRHTVCPIEELFKAADGLARAPEGFRDDPE